MRADFAFKAHGANVALENWVKGGLRMNAEGIAEEIFNPAQMALKQGH